MNESIVGTVGLLAILVYLATLVIIGWLANRALQERSLKDYYLAGGTLGSLSLFFTLYATQYSGNSLFGVPGQAYRGGLVPLGVALGMMGIILVYSLFAPKLNRLAKEQGFITLGDYIRWRFNSSALLIAVNIIVVIALTSYGLANFKALGLLLESASGGAINFPVAIMLLALIMAIYESLGGMRGVVWTDVIQGALLLSGSILIFAFVYQLRGGEGILSWQGFGKELGTYLREKANITQFASLILLTAFAAAMYPQAIQRIFASRDTNTLNRAYRAMFFMPLFTVVPLILVGISAQDWLPGLAAEDTERIAVLVVNRISEIYPSLSWLLILFLCAIIAAIMSTIDSALLSLGSTFTNDCYARNRQLSQRKLHQLGRISSWVLMLLMAVLAIFLPQTLWVLMIFKLELLIQLVPAVILGVHFAWLTARASFWGIIIGSGTAVLLKATGYVPPLLGDLHAGVIGFLTNVLTLCALTYFWKARGHRTATSEI